MRRLIRSWPLVSLALACAHAQPPHVADEDVGRLSPQQMQPVEQARQQEQTAREALARSKLGLQQAQNELKLAQADVAAADADAQRAKAVADAANQSRDPAALQNAAELRDESLLHRRSADAHVQWAKKLVAAQEAEVDASQRGLDLTQAQVDQARLTALQQAGNPAATKYDAGKFQSRVQEATKQLAASRQKAQQAQGQATTARGGYEAAQQQFEARARTQPGTKPPPSGTGSTRSP